MGPDCPGRARTGARMARAVCWATGHFEGGWAMPRMTGNRYFAEALRAHEISHLFFVPTMMLPAMAAMEDMGIRRVVTHGEKAAAYMADGYARASRRPGLCLAQTIGSANLAAGLRDAYMACLPVIALTGGRRTP